MATRSGFRPRPLDATKQLSIVRDESELDTDDSNSREVSEESAPKADAKPSKPTVQIPIPPVTHVPTYNTDYLPLHTVPLTYLKVPAKADTFDAENAEYDLDISDCQFLRDVNSGTQDRLSDRMLEAMLWKLEVLNADCTEQFMVNSGATAAERAAASAAATTEHLDPTRALNELHALGFCQAHIVSRVFEYWREKRKQRQQPTMRRLMAPTPEADNNPFAVFRQRAKPNRPHTRRRRETQEESLDRICSVLLNLQQALRLADMTRARELRKMELNNLFVDAAQYQLLSITGERPQEELDRRMVQSLKNKSQRAFDPVSLPKPGERIKRRYDDSGPLGPPLADETTSKKPKRKRQTRHKLEAIAQLPPPPDPVQPTMGFLYDLSHAEFKKGMRLSLLQDERLRQQMDEMTWEPFWAGPADGETGGAGNGDGAAAGAQDRLQALLLRV